MTKSLFTADHPPIRMVLLLPCHSLEDFPAHLESTSAESLLIGWTTLWHPELIRISKKKLDWEPADSPPDELSNSIVICPAPSESNLPTGAVDRAQRAENCLLVCQLPSSRQPLIETLLADAPAECGRVRDFYALGYAYLQVQLMTRQLRYSSNLDEDYFDAQLVAAATAWHEGNDKETVEALHNCFDLLAQERDHSFSADPFLIDLTLLADSTIGRELTATLKDENAADEQPQRPSNFLMSADLLESIQSSNSEAFELLKNRIEAKTCSVAGGMHNDTTSLDTSTISSAFHELSTARERYVHALGSPPAAFGRFGGGIPGDLPVLLNRLGYEGAIYADFAGGSDTGQDEAKLLWQAGDAEIQAICATPLDVSDAKSFLNVGPRLGEAVDSGQIATALLVHWPGAECFAYEDLRRVSQWGLALGKFHTLGDYFAESETPYHSFQPAGAGASQDWLLAGVTESMTDPLSSVADQTVAQVREEATQTLRSLRSAITGEPIDSGGTSLDEAAQQLAASLGDGSRTCTSVINPHSSATRGLTEVSGHPPAKGGHIYGASPASGNAATVIVDTPSCGFATVTPGKEPIKQHWNPFKRPKPLGTDGLLRNEFIEVAIHEANGGVRSVHTPNSRSNRFSLQLVSEDGSGGSDSTSVMKATQTKLTHSSATSASIATTGRVESAAGECHAEYQITYRVDLGSRFLQMQIELDPKREFTDNPWFSYIAARMAWAMESSTPKAILRDQIRNVSARQILSPQGVLIDDADTSTLVLASGMPAHRRMGRRMLDTMLLVKGESRRSFTLQYGFDLKNPVNASRQQLAPAPVVKDSAAPLPDTGWLFHIDSPTVIATDWSTRKDESGAIIIRVTLVETQDKSTKAHLRTFANIQSASIVSLAEDARSDLEPKGDSVRITFAGHQVTTVELTLQR